MRQEEVNDLLQLFPRHDNHVQALQVPHCNGLALAPSTLETCGAALFGLHHSLDGVPLQCALSDNSWAVNSSDEIARALQSPLSLLCARCARLRRQQTSPLPLHTLSQSWLSFSFHVYTVSLPPLPTCIYRYLALEKRRERALDPVCHFHLSNGASLWRLNWLGDTSRLGLQQSYGFMVNYEYDLSNMAQYSSSYRTSGSVALSDSFREHL